MTRPEGPNCAHPSSVGPPGGSAAWTVGESTSSMCVSPAGPATGLEVIWRGDVPSQDDIPDDPDDLIKYKTQGLYGHDRTVVLFGAKSVSVAEARLWA